MLARHLRATLGYRGTRYAGWGIQPHLPTVQTTVESALTDSLGHPVRVTAAGRTDAGVHAEGQVVSFETTSSITSDGLQRVLATKLPDDIWIREISETSSEFNARRCARRRWYRYAIWRHAVPSTEWQGRSLTNSDPLDIPAMRSAAQHLLGRHDFGSFLTRPAGPTTTDRTVFAADWLEVSPSLLFFDICADAFLKQMVRAIVGSLLLVGRGRWEPRDFATALTSTDRRAAGPNAPAVGLSLHHIEY